MEERKRGTKTERDAIKALLNNASFQKSPQYRGTWTEMLNSAASDAFYHCTLVSKTLSRSNIDDFKRLPVPAFRRDSNYELSIPSIAFVVTKIYKTLDVKLGKGGRGTLNASHYHDWVREIRAITAQLSNTNNTVCFQYLDTQRTYDPLTTVQLDYLNKFTIGTIDSDSDGIEESEDNNRVRRTRSPPPDSNDSD